MDDVEFPAHAVFLHISDIHFREGQAGDVHDPNEDLRNELERDLRTVCTTVIKKVDGIIVSGDIAFGGKSAEYKFASAWLEKIRELINCPKRTIMVTPGNHDVDRLEVPEHGDIDQMHHQVRACESTVARDGVISGILRDEDKGKRLLSSHFAYNEFAREFDCHISPEKPYWERDFPLREHSTLRIRGITSTLISGPRDHEHTHKMAYGIAQRTLTRSDNVFRMIVGHHPPSWTYDGDDADRVFSDRTVIQLFGHKHEQWFVKLGKGVRLIAGALHPDPSETNWEPRYSVIAIRVLDSRRLTIRIYPRRWTREESLFMSDFNSLGQPFRELEVEI